MFSGLSPFFNFPNANTDTSGNNAPPMFAGVPLVNPLLNDAQTNLKTLDERIAQLESVSQWLNMNLQMVNGSVQQLQVQKQTLQALAEWQKLSQGAMGELTKINPFNPPAETPADAQSEYESKPEQPLKKTQVKAKKTAAKIASEDSAAATVDEPPVIPAAFEHMAQAWWDGLQQQFAQLAQPLVDAESNKVAVATATPKSPTPPVKKTTSSRKKPSA